MRYNTVLFDADGTLLDFARSEREAVREAFLLSGISASDSELGEYSRINDSLWKQLERREIERSFLLYHRFEIFCERFGYVADAKKIAEDYITALSTKGYLLDGAEEMLCKLYGHVRMYIVTNGLGRVQRGRYAVCGIEKYFDGIFISEIIGHNKPDVRFFDSVRQSIPSFDASGTVVVGDSLSSDILGGNNAGLDTCWYNPACKPLSDIAAPTYTANNFEDICKLILE